jgi:hypothetical protein
VCCQDLEAAKRLAERHEHLEVSKIEIERSVVEMRKRYHVPSVRNASDSLQH